MRLCVRNPHRHTLITMSTVDSENPVSTNKARHYYDLLIEFASYIGPTWLISCTLIDPGAIEGALQQGAETNYQLIWVTLWATVIVLVFQYLASKLAICIQQNLGDMCYKYNHTQYSGHISTIINGLYWFGLECSVIGDDFQGIIGCMIGIQLLTGLSYWICCIIAIVAILLFSAMYYISNSKVESIVGILMFVMLICYIVNVSSAHPSPALVFKGMILPTAPSGSVLSIVGSIGGVITPSALFLQTDLILKQHKLKHAQYNEQILTSNLHKRKLCLYSVGELSIGLTISFLCNLFVICTFASAFYDPICAAQGLGNIAGQCNNFDLASAPLALQGVYGNAAQYLFGIALIASGV